MGVNAQTSVPAFTAGQVLTAQQQTEINTGVPVFATTTTRDAAFGGTGEKVLAEGQLCYIEASDVVQYYDGTSWATLGPATNPGLVLVKTTSIGTGVSTVAVTDVFSSTYTNYRVILSNTDGTGGANVTMILGASTTTYNSAGRVFYTDNTSSGFNRVNTTSWYVGLMGASNEGSISMDIYCPNLAEYTTFTAMGYIGNDFNIAGGGHNTAAAYTGFTLGVTSGTFTGGTVRVYGYRNSV